VVSSTPRLHFNPRKDPVPILQEAVCAPRPVWTGVKSRPHRNSIPDRPGRSQSLYRLSYPAHLLSGNTVVKFKEGYFSSEQDDIFRKHQFICDEQMETDFTDDSVSRTTFRVDTFPTKNRHRYSYNFSNLARKLNRRLCDPGQRLCPLLQQFACGHRP